MRLKVFERRSGAQWDVLPDGRRWAGSASHDKAGGISKRSDQHVTGPGPHWTHGTRACNFQTRWVGNTEILRPDLV